MTRFSRLNMLSLLVGLGIWTAVLPGVVRAYQEPEGTPDATLRPVVGGSRGMVASNHPQASMAGVEVMMKGGNAFDAAIAVGAALGVVEPFMSGLGGIGWMLIYHADTKEYHVLNFSGRSPAALTAGHFKDRIARGGPLVPMVPGSAAAWEEVSRKFGTLKPAELLAPAIRLASDGFAVTGFGAARFEDVTTQFNDWDGIGAKTWWEGAKVAPKQGDRVRNPALAQTYRTLAEQGFGAFYKGAIPREIAATYQRFGGVITEADFANYKPTWEKPITTTYRGYDVLTVAPNSSGGLAVLQILNILEGFDLKSMGVNSADYIHVVTEAVKLAAADRARWAGDPEVMKEPIPLDRLLSKEYAAKLRAGIALKRAAMAPNTGTSQVGTTHYTVVDGKGNMLAVTTTMGGGFGSGLVGGTTGVALNNGVSWFELDPKSPAYLEGSKRTRWNMAPTMIAKDGAPFIAIGTPGGTTIWQTVPQLVTKLVDFGMDIQSAIESPRFRWELGGTTVRPEGRISTTVLDALRTSGHDVKPLVDWTSGVGGMNGIMIDRQNGLMKGGADPRRDGYVIGY
jgi:gamma-glutamyltranspeptidase/glutathione hydrolase